MYYPTNDFLEMSEYFIYGIPSLVADFGGYLGLLMGHNPLSLYGKGKLFCRKWMEQMNAWLLHDMVSALQLWGNCRHAVVVEAYLKDNYTKCSTVAKLNRNWSSE